MRTIEEFNAGHAAVSRRLIVVAGIGIVTLFLGFSVIYLLGESGYYSRPPDDTPLFFLLFLGCVFPGMTIFLGGAWWVTERWARRDGRIVCPHCDTVLLGKRPWVVATRNCQLCGKRVVAEPVEAA
jgi:hypothetical protein